MIKVGDEVELTEYTNGNEAGMRGIVTEILSMQVPYPYRIQMDENDSNALYTRSEFKLVDKAVTTAPEVSYTQHSFVTKYKVGDKLYLPRSKKMYDEKSVVVDGVTYYTDIGKLVASVVTKVVKQIKYTIDDKGNRLTYVLGYSDSDSFLTTKVSAMDLIAYDTEEDAMKMAQQFVDNNKDYYG